MGLSLSGRVIIYVGLMLLMSFSHGQGQLDHTIERLPGSEFDLWNAEALLSYDAVTDELVGVTEDVSLRELVGNTDVITDLTGSFMITAIVDENRVMTGGSFAWRGGSADFGIPDDTLLMAGEFIASAFSNHSRPQFIGDVQVVVPQLEVVMGSIETVLWFGGIAEIALCDINNPFDTTQNLTCSWTIESPQNLTGIQFSTTPYTDIDSDIDLIRNDIDNCSLLENYDQLDTDTDELGNACDADFNQDCIVNFLDVALFSGEFLSSNALYDLNGDGTVNFLDYAVVSSAFLQPPGPGTFDECNLPVVTEDFDDGPSGWTFGEQVSWHAFVGNPTGSLRFSVGPAPAGDTGSRVFAPPSYLGDWSHFNQSGLLVFEQDIYTALITVSHSPVEVLISGPGGSATWTGPAVQSSIVPWTRMIVPLDQNLFVVNSGDWGAILQNVTELAIKLPASNSFVSTTTFDNFSLRQTFP